MSRSVDGLLLVDKPSGPTSHDIVHRARRAIGQRRVGHAGTLDPLASGLLPLVLGAATRLVRFLPTSPKIYTGVFELGWSSSSDDISGEELSRHSGPLPDADQVLRVSGEFLGSSLQLPPKVSARRHQGRRLYELARQGLEVPRTATEVQISRFDLHPTAVPGRYQFLAEVTGGTYIRSLVRDLGDRLSCGGVLAELRRTRIGSMDVLDAIKGTPHADAIIPLEQMPLEPPRLQLSDPEEALRFSRGNELSLADGGDPPGYRTVLSPDGRLIGIGESGGGCIAPRVVLPGAVAVG